jgi:regulator of replication initiation timing
MLGKGQRAARTARNLYAELNQPIRNQGRAPLPPEPPAASPRPRIVAGKALTDTARFRSVEDRTLSLESIISSARRGSAADIQAWIEGHDPSPIAILRRIASVSPPHERVLTLIADELARFPLGSLEEPIFELNDDAMDEISDIQGRIHDLARETEALEQEEELLKGQLAEARAARAEVQSEWERYRNLIGRSTFTPQGDAERDAQQRRAEALILRGDEEHERSVTYNQLWGANKFLKGETEALQAKINEQRAYHASYIAKKAAARYRTERPAGGEE